MAKKGMAPDVAKPPVAVESTVSHSVSVIANEKEASSGNGKYTVVARRYRPKTFAELVGQSTVSQALLSAIASNRVGHAYLFTGARGVGKTSTARIFAKALNAAAETNGQFDPNSDISQAIDAGEDMDVLEIDGASNRGIDEIRQLRSNAAVRPSRSRYKIYIIDEVHMLTTQAFNALLKTLEEPPGHVKFIFCTTDPEKIPITVLSRCQRFDFPPVHTEQIYERLKFICENEGTKADEAALRLIARRAAGSMRDSQSLLEQLLSFSGNEITADVVHAMLGTADETRLASFASRLIERDAASALRELNTAAEEGVDMGQLAEQLLGYLRDMMTVTVGGASDLIRTANPSSADQLKEWGKTWGTMTLLSALQLLDETIVKMRHSVQSRILLEVALVQICNLQDLQALSELVKAFATQSAPTPRAGVPSPTVSLSAESKKKVELAPPQLKPATPSPAESAPTATPTITPQENSLKAKSPQLNSPTVDWPDGVLSDSSSSGRVVIPDPKTVAVAAKDVPAKDVRPEPPKEAQIPAPASAAPISSSAPQHIGPIAIEPTVAPNPSDRIAIVRDEAGRLGGLAGECALMAVRVECITEQQWRICLSRDGTMALNYFQSAENGRKLAQGISERLGRDIRVEFAMTQEPTTAQEVSATQPTEAQPMTQTNRATIPQPQLIRNAMLHPLIKQFMEVFEGQVVRVDPAQSAVQPPNLAFQKSSPDKAEEIPLREQLRGTMSLETVAFD